MVNHKFLAIQKIQEIASQFPDYTLGQILYMVLRPKNLNSGADVTDVSWLRDVTSEAIYNASEKALRDEKNDRPMTDDEFRELQGRVKHTYIQLTKNQ